jgi:hypothetical protein
VTAAAAFIVTVHVAPSTASQPLHPVKRDSEVGVVVSVTVVPRS